MEYNVIESLSCLTHGIIYQEQACDRDSFEKFSNFIPNLNIFLKNTIEEKFNPAEVEIV